MRPCVAEPNCCGDLSGLQALNRRLLALAVLHRSGAPAWMKLITTAVSTKARQSYYDWLLLDQTEPQSGLGSCEAGPHQQRRLDACAIPWFANLL